MISGIRLVQTPGPATMPAEVLEAMGRQSIDHRSDEFAALTRRLLNRLGQVFATQDPIVVLASSGTGAWESALVNTLSPGARVLVIDNGFFAGKWAELAEDLGFRVDRLETPWGEPVDLEALGARLREDPDGAVRAVCVVHGETSTGAVADVPEVRRMLDDEGHPALLLVDAISSAFVNDYRHDEWGVDVTVCASQKGLMAPPGVGINVVGARALEASHAATSPRHYWRWGDVLDQNASGFFPRTPATNLLAALDVSTGLILEETLPAVLNRHSRLAAAARRAVDAWGFALVAPDAVQSAGVTAFLLPEDADSDRLHDEVLDSYAVATGRGLGRLKGRAFRIGHLGATTETTLVAALAATELGLRRLGVSVAAPGLDAAVGVLGGSAVE